MRVLIWGASGWVGSLFGAYARAVLGANAVIAAKSRLGAPDSVEAEMDAVKPDRIVLAAGIKGWPNVDWCEAHAAETFAINTVATIHLARAASARGIHVTNVSSGCVFEYDDAHPVAGAPFTEQDSPNFFGSVYSQSKAAAEMAVRDLPGHLLLRIRMPVTADNAPGCLLTKIANYARVISVPNSITVLRDLLPLAVTLMVDGDTGVYNLVNPGPVTHDRLLGIYKQLVDPDFVVTTMTVEEQDATVLKARRSNNALDVSKLQQRFPDVVIPTAEDSVRNLVQLHQPVLVRPPGRHVPRTVLVTGGAGFIGSHFIEYMAAEYPCTRFVILDAMLEPASEVFASNLPPRTTLERANIADAGRVKSVLADSPVDTVVHFAAHTHVDASFSSSVAFTENNVLGTHRLIQACVEAGFRGRFVHISTDEVYGESAAGASACEDRSLLQPTNPYAASKVGAEALVHSYVASGKLDAVILRANNAYGPRQFPEKLVPRFLVRALSGLSLQVQGDGTQTRNFLYVLDLAAAVRTVLVHGHTGGTYNVRSDEELSVLAVAHQVLRCTGRPEDDVVHVPDRRFNDKRYNIDDTKLRALGWAPTTPFLVGLAATADWYNSNLASLSTHWPHAPAGVHALDPASP